MKKIKRLHPNHGRLLMRSSALIGRALGAARIGITTLPAEIFIPFKQPAWLISLYAVRETFFLKY